MQILHPFAGSVQQYTEQLANPDCYRPGHCQQCQTKHPRPKRVGARVFWTERARFLLVFSAMPEYRQGPENRL